MASLALVWDLIARDNASPAFARVGAAAESTAAKTDAAAAKVSGGMSTMAKAGALAGVAFAAASVKMAADFQSSTVRLVTSANESQKNLKMVQQGMLDLAGAAGYGTDELAKAMYKVESGGQHGADALLTLKAAAQGAKTENADLTTVADALTSALTDYHLPASKAADVTSKLVAATASGKMTFEELSGSLAAILPVASANHVALNDILGDLASMTMHGMSAEQASQNLADAIRHLAAPTQQQQKEFAALGLTAQQITADLGTKGLSGTINVIGDAIKAQMGPGSSQVVLNLGTALEKLPAPVRKLGESILDGTISLGDYRKAMKALPAEQAIAAQSFMGLVSSTHQIGNETKNGAEIYQSYSGALRQALGDATGMNVALMIGGENAGNTAKAIDNVSKATHEAGGNVKGWAEIQGTFNQQASETLHSLEAMTIEVGMKMLPALTAGMGYINRDAIPALKSLGSGVEDAAHWFGELPGPVKAVAEAMAGLALANAIGLFEKLGNGIVYGRVLMAEYAATTSASMGTISLAYREAAASAAALQAVQGSAALTGAASSIAGLGAAAGATAKVGFGAMRTAGAGLVSFLGGPWVVGIGAAVGGLLMMQSAVKNHDEAVKTATADVAKWYQTLALGGKSTDINQAQQNLQGLRDKLAAAKDTLNEMTAAQANSLAPSRMSAATISRQKDVVNELSSELSRGQKKWDDYWNSLSPQGKAAAQVAADEAALADAIQRHGTASEEARVAGAHYRDDLERQKTLTGEVTAAQQSQIDKTNQLATAQLTAISSTLADSQAQASLADAVAQYNADAKDGQHSTKQLADESNNLAQQAISAAQAAAQHAVDQAKANGVTDDGTIANKVLLDALKRSADQITGPGHDALVTAITDLEKTTIGSGTLADTVSKMGITVAGVWDDNTRVLKGATDQQITDLTNLGLTVMHLPNGQVVVTADTGPARDQMQHLVDSYKNYSININPQGMALTTEQRNLLYSGKAAGGPIHGPGSGTSDTAGLFALSNGEHVWTAREVAAAGGHGAVESLRKAVVAGGRGMADGGAVVTESARFSDAYMAAAAALIAKMGALGKANADAASGGPAGAGVQRWLPTVLQSLEMMGQPASLAQTVLRRMQQESGGNPAAVNRTDSNWLRGTPSVGLMQVIGPTYRAFKDSRHDVGPYLYGSSEDGLSNILASEHYAISRYGSLSAAYNKAGGYDNGGPLMPGYTLAYNGTGKPENVQTAAQAAASQQPVQVRVFIGDRELTDIVRVEAEGVVGGALTAARNRGRYNG